MFIGNKYDANDANDANVDTDSDPLVARKSRKSPGSVGRDISGILADERRRDAGLRRIGVGQPGRASDRSVLEHLQASSPEQKWRQKCFRKRKLWFEWILKKSARHQKTKNETRWSETLKDSFLRLIKTTGSFEAELSDQISSKQRKLFFQYNVASRQAWYQTQ